jgi:hypothetical protein
MEQRHERNDAFSEGYFTMLSNQTVGSLIAGMTDDEELEDILKEATVI